jgi:nitrate/TMAO reductase-like tetraheme cytochrome c subunit
LAKKPDSCGKCHVLVFDKYKESTHGREALNGNLNAPLCVDCHGDHKIISPVDEKALTSRRNVINTCAACHIQPKVMKKFGFTEDGMKSFVQSAHDITIGENNNAAVNCTSCHGFHDIRPSTDLSSRINQRNLAKTCGQDSCHPGIPDELANSKIHFEIKQKKSALRFYLQNLFFCIFFALTLIIAIWFIRKFIRKRYLIKRIEK